jgi:long-chain acyl-CoA synthetase
VKGYLADKSTKSEGIEALVYPSDDLVKRLGINRADAVKSREVYAAINEIVERVNKIMPPYSKISKITLLEQALEMTTTKKVKR